MGYVCGVENAAPCSYWTIQNLFQLYQGLLKSNPILTKSITSGVIACLGSSLSQVTLFVWASYAKLSYKRNLIVDDKNTLECFAQNFQETCFGAFSFQFVGEGAVSLKISRSFLIFGSLVTGKMFQYFLCIINKQYPASIVVTLLRPGILTGDRETCSDIG